MKIHLKSSHLKIKKLNKLLLVCHPCPILSSKQKKFPSNGCFNKSEQDKMKTLVISNEMGPTLLTYR